MLLMWTGNEFQAAGPATVNELSASRVLVRRTTNNAAQRRTTIVCNNNYYYFIFTQLLCMAIGIEHINDYTVIRGSVRTKISDLLSRLNIIAATAVRCRLPVPDTELLDSELNMEPLPKPEISKNAISRKYK